MKDVGPEHYRALHLDDGRARGATRRGVNPSSPIAVLLASLVVSAHGGADGALDDSSDAATASRPDRGDDGAPTLASVGALAQRWRSAIANDDTVALGALLADRPDLGLPAQSADNGKTALMVAAKSDDLPLVQALVGGGARLEQRTLTGGTAVMFAALGEELDVIVWLHEQGAALDATGSNGWTALTIAAARGRAPMVDWLMSQGVDASPVDVYGFTPLMRAAENGHDDVVSRMLQDDTLNLEHRDEAGNTALHHAVAGTRPDIVTLLLDAGASATIRNRAGYTPREASDDPAVRAAFDAH